MNEGQLYQAGTHWPFFGRSFLILGYSGGADVKFSISQLFLINLFLKGSLKIRPLHPDASLEGPTPVF